MVFNETTNYDFVLPGKNCQRHFKTRAESAKVWELTQKQGGWKMAEVPFHNHIIGNFMAYHDRLEANLLLQFALRENSEWFSMISVIFELNIFAEKKDIGNEILFFKVSNSLNYFTAPSAHRCSNVPALRNQSSGTDPTTKIMGEGDFSMCRSQVWFAGSLV